MQRALEYYRQAVELDPGYGLAWAGIAHALATSVATIDASRASLREDSEEALERALEYAPELAETQLALASYHGFLTRDYASAQAAARRAIQLDPNSAMAHMFLGLSLTQTGDYVEGRSMLQRARELDPLFPLMFANSANAAILAGQPREALEYAMQAVAIDPEFWVGHLHLGYANLEIGDHDAALQAFTEADRLTGYQSGRIAAARAFLLARAGHTEEAHDIFAELTEPTRRRNVRAEYIAIVYAGLGETNSALDWLERGIEQGEVFCLNLERRSYFDNLKGHARFEALLNRCSANEMVRSGGI